MSQTVATVLVVALLALIVIVVANLFRGNIKTKLKGPFGTKLDIEGTNPSAADQAALHAKGIISREGGISAEDTTGRGINAEDFDAKLDVHLSTGNPEVPLHPKSPPRP